MGLEDAIDISLAIGDPHPVDVMLAANAIRNSNNYDSRLNKWGYLKMRVSYALGLYKIGHVKMEM